MKRFRVFGLTLSVIFVALVSQAKADVKIKIDGSTSATAIGTKFKEAPAAIPVVKQYQTHPKFVQLLACAKAVSGKKASINFNNSHQIKTFIRIGTKEAAVDVPIGMTFVDLDTNGTGWSFVMMISENPTTPNLVSFRLFGRKDGWLGKEAIEWRINAKSELKECKNSKVDKLKDAARDIIKMKKPGAADKITDRFNATPGDFYARFRAATDIRTPGYGQAAETFDAVLAMLAINAPANEYGTAVINNDLNNLKPATPQQQMNAQLKAVLKKALEKLVEELVQYFFDKIGF